MVETGFHCTNPGALQERLIIWEGLDLVQRAEGDPDNAVFDDVPLILPRGEPRPATMEDTLEIIATPDTKRVMQLCWLPQSVGELLVRECQSAPPFNQNLPHSQLTEHISGQYMSVRDDPAGSLTVTRRISASPPQVARPVKVGYHIDIWNAENFKLAVINAGPGERVHCIVPSLTRSLIGGADRQSRIDYFEQNPHNNAKIFGIRLDPPSTRYQAIFGSPVADYLHDGSTVTSRQGSKVVFVATDEIAVGAYSSPLS